MRCACRGCAPVDRRFPFPAVLRGRRGGPWTIREGRGVTCVATHEMWVPLGDTLRDRRVRQHELAHAAFSPAAPRIPGDLRHDLVQYVEEARVHALLAVAGVDLGARIFTEVANRMLHELPGGVLHPESLVLMLLGLAGTGDYEATLSVIDDRLEGDESLVARYSPYLTVARTASEMIAASPGSFGSTIRVARWLQERLALISEAHQSGVAIPTGALREPGAEADDSSLTWGSLRIEKPPMRLGRGAPGGPRTRSSPSGLVPSALHRLLIDQRVFRDRKTRRAGPSVLIDYSTSMGLHRAKVDRFVRGLSQGLVATYSGEKLGGVLRVVADGGRSAGTRYLDQPAGSGNIVDGPALDWLARQSSPRIWVTDGLVTGIGDQFSSNLLREALETCRRRGIRLVRSLRGLEKTLRTRRKTGRPRT